MADTGTWLNERQVLLSPYSFGRLDLEDKMLVFELTKQQILTKEDIERTGEHHIARAHS